MNPPIGVPRLYHGRVPVLYPGETMSAQVSVDAVQAAFDAGRTEVEVEDWLVEPMPGAWGAFLRWRYRLIGRWWPWGKPRLEQSVHVERRRP